MAISLYHTRFSTCSQKVRLVLAEKSLPYESRLVNMQASEHLGEEYLRINPNGVVPTLIDDGRIIGDSSVICEYLDEVYPSPALSPPDAFGRAQMRMWMHYFDEVTTPAVRVPSFNLVFVKNVRPDRHEQFEAMTARMPLRRHFYREMGDAGFPEKMMNESLERLQAAFERVERALEQSGDWLIGRFGLADVLLVPAVVRMADLGFAHLWAGLPRLTAWLARVEGRPSFATAYFPGSRLTLETG